MSTMHVRGVKRVHGVSPKGPYDFAELFLESAVETGKFGAATIEGGGNEPVSMEIDPAVVKQFEGVAFPADLVIKTASKAVRGDWKTVCVGVERVAVAAAAASAVKGKAA